MSEKNLAAAVQTCLLLLVPVSVLAMLYAPTQMDGDGMAYLDIADLIHAHQWVGVVNGYWNPLYPWLLNVGKTALHVGRADELLAAYVVNLACFWMCVAAAMALVVALDRLRGRWSDARPGLSRPALQLVAIALVVISAGRELRICFVRPDALLEALVLGALAALLMSFVAESVAWPMVLGLLFGLGYLAKSFALPVAFIAIAVMVGVQIVLLKRGVVKAVTAGVLAGLVFGAVAGPYVAALSKQRGRLDFGDSGNLNYVWYVSGTRKNHVQPWMTERFGSATVELKHPEVELMRHPGVYSAGAVPYGEYPAWFDPTYFHDRITPRFDAGRLAHRVVRNVALSVRYLGNHPEGLVLLVVLVVLGARVRWSRPKTWLAPVALGLVMWGMYALVNVEERYVTLAFLAMLLPVFAVLEDGGEQRWTAGANGVLCVLLCGLAATEMLRTALEDRRHNTAGVGAWHDAEADAIAARLAATGVAPGAHLACMNTMACLHAPYWMRRAEVRVQTEVYQPETAHGFLQWASLENRDAVLATLRGQGDVALITRFDAAEMQSRPDVAAGWVALGVEDYYVYPLAALHAPRQPVVEWKEATAEAP